VHRHTGRATVHEGGLASACVFRRSSGEKVENAGAALRGVGRIVEIGDTAEIFANPRHPYTVSLLKAIPDPDPARSIPRDLPELRWAEAGDERFVTERRPPSGSTIRPTRSSARSAACTPPAFSISEEPG
jgi:peptide/nickel transport system ATP-binding protein